MKRASFGNTTVNEVAERFGTPTYLTDFSLIEENFSHMARSFKPLQRVKIFYSVKANSNPFILKFLNHLGAGLDILSQGELSLAIRSGIRPDEMMLSGTMIEDSLFESVARLGIRTNLDSIESISRAARRGLKSAGIRLNPLVEAGHHAKVRTATARTKFGIALDEYGKARSEFERNNMVLEGLHYHIGSGITDARPFVSALEQVRDAVQDLASLHYLDIGGGYAMSTSGEHFDFAPLVNALTAQALPDQLFVETGRYLVANSTVLLTKVVEVKKTSGKTFVGVDAGFNDMMRTVLYGAEHPIMICSDEGEEVVGDLVGPICESGDVFRTDIQMKVKEGSLVAILNVGAYGYSLSSNYLVRPRAPEIGTYKGEIFEMRKRESVEDLSAKVNWEHFKKFLL